MLAEGIQPVSRAPEAAVELGAEKRLLEALVFARFASRGGEPQAVATTAHTSMAVTSRSVLTA